MGDALRFPVRIRTVMGPGDPWVSGKHLPAGQLSRGSQSLSSRHRPTGTDWETFVTIGPFHFNPLQEDLNGNGIGGQM